MHIFITFMLVNNHWVVRGRPWCGRSIRPFLVGIITRMAPLSGEESSANSLIVLYPMIL